MVTNAEYMQIISESYDLSDYNTKKKLLFCNEAKRIDNLEHIVNNLYLHIKSNVSGIDFGTIPRSKGVVTRIDNYANILDCINSVHELVFTYKERTDIPDALSTALANIQQRERLFTKAFALNIEFPIMIYNMTVLAVVSSVSLLLSGTVEYVKNGHDSFAVSFDKVGYTKSRDHVLYQYVTQFNRNCDNGTLDKLMNECIKNNLTPVSEASEEYVEEGFKDVASAAFDAAKAFAGGKAAYDAVKGTGLVGALMKSKPLRVVTFIIATGFAAITIIKFLAKASFFIMSASLKFSDWIEVQATYLQINAENLKYRDDPKGDSHRKQVYQNQMKWVARFKKLANFVDLTKSKADKKTKDAEDDYRNRRTGDDDYYDDDDNDDGLF